MGHQIIRQPNGKYCIWSSHVDSIILFDATSDDLVEYYGNKAAQDSKLNIIRVVDKLDRGQARLIYHQFTMSYAEALERSRETNTVEEI